MQAGAHQKKGLGATVENASQAIRDQQLSAGEAALEIFREYARERPEAVAMWAFGLGFVLGWKLKIW